MEQFEAKDVDEGKSLAWLSYLGILLLIPFLTQKDNPYTKYHMKQGLALLIVYVAVTFVSWIPILGWLVGIVGYPAALVIMVIGIVNAATGKAKPLPIIGKIGESFKI